MERKRDYGRESMIGEGERKPKRPSSWVSFKRKVPIKLKGLASPQSRKREKNRKASRVSFNIGGGRWNFFAQTDIKRTLLQRKAKSPIKRRAGGTALSVPRYFQEDNRAMLSLSTGKKVLHAGWKKRPA